MQVKPNHMTACMERALDNPSWQHCILSNPCTHTMYAIRMQLLGYGGAAHEGNLDEVQRLFRTGEASPTDRDGDGWTALLWASHGEQLHVVQWLLREGGSSIDEADNDGWTALLYAAGNQNWDTVRWLLEEGGADVHDRSNDGWTALLWAVQYLHVATVQFLLRECGAAIADVRNNGRDVWANMKLGLERRDKDDLPKPAALADLYSVLRCYSSPTDPTAFIEGLIIYSDVLPAAHRDLLLQTERAHANPNLGPYRAQRLALLHEGTDFADIVIPDLQNIVLGLAQPTAEDQLSAAVIAEAAEADEWARVHGRNVRRRVE